MEWFVFSSGLGEEPRKLTTEQVVELIRRQVIGVNAQIMRTNDPSKKWIPIADTDFAKVFASLEQKQREAKEAAKAQKQEMKNKAKQEREEAQRLAEIEKHRQQQERSNQNDTGLRIDGSRAGRNDGGASLSPNTVPSIDANWLPIYENTSLPPRAIANLDSEELVHHYITGRRKEVPRKTCAFIKNNTPQETRTTQNWAMITNKKIVVETELQSVTESAQVTDKLSTFSFFTSFLEEVISVKAEAIVSKLDVKGCGGKSDKDNTYVLVINLTRGESSIYVNNLQELLDVQKTLMVLLQKGEKK